MPGHVVLGQAVDEGGERNRLVQHECVAGQEERGHQDRRGLLAEPVGDATQDGDLAPQMGCQVRPARVLGDDPLEIPWVEETRLSKVGREPETTPRATAAIAASTLRR